ncbi:MAG: carboxypeptidase-like regulatory domain-containing protein, partial [Muribaculaceae bacterium]|nr:carboxypeptidase-like regulatory domain-containing protein [Muribaculaceae bacterium]
VYTGHNFNATVEASLFDDMRRSIEAADAREKSPEYWSANRLADIGHGENRMAEFITRMRKVPLYYWTEKILRILVSGYISTGPNSKWDFGPMNTSLSFNDIEGLRMRAGGMTTANLSPHWFGRGYVAYGTKDHKWKYKGELEYSFNKKRYHSREFPVQSLRLTHMYDLDMLGQHYLFTNPDNVFLSLKRQPDTQMTYRRLTQLEFIMELYNNFSILITAASERQEATRYMPFFNAYGIHFGHYNETSLKLQLRYAPGEKFYQTKTYRYPINMDAPVFLISHIIAPKKSFGNMFALNKTEASIQKRFWFSAFGYLDAIISGGHVWSRSPYPNLLIPNANLSYTIQPESYALMNAMEFINDSYASCDLTYWANGAILNYVPVLKRLKWREAFSFRALWGHLSNKNNPDLNPELFRFPSDAHSRRMTSQPYMEAGVGLDNIFKILRVDYVWRLSYRNSYRCDKSGVRIALHFTF